MSPLAKSILLLCILTRYLSLPAQQPMVDQPWNWPVKDAGEWMDEACENNPTLKAAALEISRQQDLVAAAVNLPAPQVILQNTTGNFFTVGVQQSLDFPTVYAAQKKLQKEQVVLAQKAQSVELLDQKYLLSLYYAEYQYRYELIALWQSQDSAFAKMADQAQRQFAAGEVDFLQASYAKAEAATTAVAASQALAEFKALAAKIQALTGSKENFRPTAPELSKVGRRESETRLALGGNPTLATLIQNTVISRRSYQLERQRWLPGITVGLINNGERSTTYPNRIYAGLGLPIWFWQYKGRTAAAKKAISVDELRLEAKQRQLGADLDQAMVQNQAFAASLQTYETTILPTAMELADAARRMFQAGMRTYADYLRTLKDVSSIRIAFWETWKNYVQNSIYIDYLCGTL
jgi:outer membrane protein, heavy metal efflux system